jgi:AbrB family looped-hinge helix DNA binding protein
MAERIIRPVNKEGRVTIPKELRAKFKINDYVEFEETEDGLLIKPLFKA